MTCIIYMRPIYVCVCVYPYVPYASSLQYVQLFATPWTVAHQAPLPMVFSRQESWGGLPCPPPKDLPNPGIYMCVYVCVCIYMYIDIYTYRYRFLLIQRKESS